GRVHHEEEHEGQQVHPDQDRNRVQHAAQEIGQHQRKVPVSVCAVAVSLRRQCRTAGATSASSSSATSPSGHSTGRFHCARPSSGEFTTKKSTKVSRFTPIRIGTAYSTRRRR